MPDNEKKLTEKECVKYGGHCWEYDTAAELINSEAVTFGTSFEECTIFHRICKHCGKKQVEVPLTWSDV